MLDIDSLYYKILLWCLICKWMRTDRKKEEIFNTWLTYYSLSSAVHILFYIIFLLNIILTCRQQLYYIWYSKLCFVFCKLVNVFQACFYEGPLRFFYSTNFFHFQHKPPFEVNDLFEDIKDGVKLLALLEVLSGQRLVSVTNAISPFLTSDTTDYPSVPAVMSCSVYLIKDNGLDTVLFSFLLLTILSPFL